MIADDFFMYPDPWEPGYNTANPELNLALLNSLRAGAIEGRTDLEAAIALAALVDAELLAYGTKGDQTLTDDEIGRCLAALQSVCKRVGVNFAPPFRNFSSFRAYWERNDGYGSWAARRKILAELFEPLHLELTQLEEKTFDALVDPVSPRAEVGWPVVDEEIRELRRRFQSATTPQDYRALGTNCVGVIEALGRTVYDASKHVREGEEALSVDKTKLRIGRYVEDALEGSSNIEVRGVVNKTIELAHHIKHSGSSRRDAGIAADAVILLANILRRLDS